jgi:hypothetical protein
MLISRQPTRLSAHFDPAIAFWQRWRTLLILKWAILLRSTTPILALCCHFLLMPREFNRVEESDAKVTAQVERGCPQPQQPQLPRLAK